jgi:multiple sugar transport system substrate-binding protein
MANPRQTILRVLLVGGPMYDPLYESIPRFERDTGWPVDIVARLPHPALNARVADMLRSEDGGIDLISTHTKYAPSQADWLSTLDDVTEPGHVEDLVPRAAELCRIGGRLLQMPRNLDVRLLHYRTDLFDDPHEQAAFERRYGRPLQVPVTWTELADVAAFFTRPGLYGFLFPGRDSGLFGTFYELLVGAGGELFDGDRRPAFESAAGVWAAGFLAHLHDRLRVTPRELPAWHYDEVAAAFQDGRAAMVTDWPGSYHRYRNPETCRVWDRVGLAALPAGPANIRAGYAGCHSFAIPASARCREGAGALLRYLLSFESQLGEAQRGAIPCRASALSRVAGDAASQTADRERWRLLTEAEQTMIVPPRFAAFPRCEDAIWQSMQLAMQGLATPADAVSAAATGIRGILDTRAVPS